jgi:hypothetical protein
MAAPDPGLAALAPCTIGLSIEYSHEVKNRGGTLTSKETVLGPGKEANICLIRRQSGGLDEVWARELLDKSVNYAGYEGQLLAFRPPLIKAPVQKATRWRFNTTDYEIEGAGISFEVPAGTFDGCVRVAEKSRDGKHEAYAVYAPGVGLIAYESRDQRMRATRVLRHSKENSKKTSK